VKTNIEFKRYIRGDLSLKKEIWFYSDEGYKGWWLNGKYHREDGPARMWSDGSKSWWLNGKRHREDGPAIEYWDGTKYWYLNGKYHTEEDYWKALEEYKKKNIK